jgi:hypothetical protein
LFQILSASNQQQIMIIQHHLQYTSSFYITPYTIDKTTRNILLILVQEVKIDIIYRRMNLPLSAQQITDLQQLAGHMDSTLRRLHSYLKYIGFVKFPKASEVLAQLQEINKD